MLHPWVVRIMIMLWARSPLLKVNTERVLESTESAPAPPTRARSVRNEFRNVCSGKWDSPPSFFRGVVGESHLNLSVWFSKILSAFGVRWNVFGSISHQLRQLKTTQVVLSFVPILLRYNNSQWLSIECVDPLRRRCLRQTQYINSVRSKQVWNSAKRKSNMDASVFERNMYIQN